jgi:subtilisin family serine protease
VTVTTSAARERRIVLVVTVLITAALLLAMPSRPTGWGGDGFRALPGELLVGYRSGTPEATKDGIAAAIGARRAGGIGPLNVEILDLSDERIDHVARLLRSDPSVAFVERDPVAHAAETTPNDPYWPEQWGPVRTRTNLAWDATTGSSEVVIAIIDSGVNPVADLGGKVLSGYDYVGRDSDPADENGHGTKAAGVAAAVGSNSEGVAGYCWGCRILPVRVLDSTGYGSYSNIASGITWAVDHGARILNLSLGGSSSSSTLAAAVDYALRKGALVIAASGNQGCDCILYPARLLGVIAVGATEQDDSFAYYSNWGADRGGRSPPGGRAQAESPRAAGASRGRWPTRGSLLG